MRILFLITGFIFFLAPVIIHGQLRKIIDVHFHARLVADYPNPPAPNPKTGKIPEWKNDKEMMDIMLATLKNNNVVKVIASGSVTTVARYQMADSERVIPGFDYPYEGNSSLPDTVAFLRYIKEKKITLPLIYTLNKVHSPKRKELIYILKNNNKDEKKVQVVIDSVIAEGGIVYAQQKMYEYRDQALEILNSFPDTAVRRALEELVRFTTDRKY